MNLEQVLALYGNVASTAAVIGIFLNARKIAKNNQWAQEEKKHREAEAARLNEQIELVLVEENGARKITFPAKIRRSQLTRAEVQGRLSVQGERYKLPYINTHECLEKIDHLYVSSGQANTQLTIRCDTSEIERFEAAELRKYGFRLSGFES